MYGPLTSERRRLAMKERKILKDNNDIVSGYVAFPAKLMVKKTSNGKYQCHKDFSGVSVKLSIKD